jgi:hypothetical protein
MTLRTYAVVAMTTFMISAPIWVAQASAQSAVVTGELEYDVAHVATPAIDVSAKRHYHHHQRYYRGAYYRSYRPTLPYDGYRPYPPPLYHCPYYGSPIPLYPYCWGW